MDFTTLIVIFLAFTSVTVVTNTLLIWFAYRGFANVTTKITQTVREIETSGETRRWLESLRSASEQAVTATEVTKQKMAEFDPTIDDYQARYEFLLAQIDTKIARMADDVSDSATLVRDAVAGPATQFAAAASGIQNLLNFLAPLTADRPGRD